MENGTKQGFKLRGLMTFLLVLSLFIDIVSGVILYIVPHGRVAYWSDWRLWGLSKTQWTNLHLNLGILLLLAGLLHIYYNWKPMTSYLRNKIKHIKVFTGSFNIALLLTLVFIIGTLFEIPPMSTIINISESIKDAAANKYGEPPYGHAELSSLKAFTRKENLDLQKSVELLQQAGIRYKNNKQPIGEIAKQNNLTPKQVYETIKPAKKKNSIDDRSAFPNSPPPGFGKKTLAEVCIVFSLHMPDILHALSSKGVKAEPTHSIKEIATKNKLKPMAIFEIIRGTINGS